MSRSPAVVAALTLATTLMASSAALHAIAYPGTVASFGSTSLREGLIRSVEAVWLANSTNLFAASLLCVLEVCRPSSLSRLAVATVSLVPLCSAVILFRTVGAFPPAFLMSAAAAAILFAALHRQDGRLAKG